MDHSRFESILGPLILEPPTPAGSWAQIEKLMPSCPCAGFDRSALTGWPRLSLRSFFLVVFLGC